MSTCINIIPMIQIQMEKVKNPWPSFRDWRKSCINYGLAEKEVFTGLIEGTLQMAQDGLEARGLGEEVFLNSLYERLEQGKNPAQQIREISSSGGISALIDYASIRSKW